MNRTRTIHWSLFCCLLLVGLQASAQVYGDYLGAGHTQGITVTSSTVEAGFDTDATIDGHGIDSAYAKVQAARFLEQATLGANRELIDEVAKMGFEAWIDAQLALAPSSLTDHLEYALDQIAARCNDLGGGPDICNLLSEEYAFRFQYGWWQAAMIGEDQLRQRVALALSEIFVISGLTFSDQPLAFALTDYYDMLLENAFGNFEDLLLDVTLHPFMGVYLTHFNNPRAVPSLNIRPDENYAREVMQLFTIGLFELNMDGTEKLDLNGEPIPTYDNEDIKEFAKVFTGLGDGGANGQFGVPPNPFFTDFTVPMQMFEFWHEPGPKFLLNGFVIPNGQTGMEDIEMAINHLFNHPNTAPFISYRLIQRLVKSNPSPAYVERVANVFADNGQGTRGDLAAVIKAILLDPEARDCSWTENNDNGKLREPILRYTHVLRALDASNEVDEYWNAPAYFYDKTRQLPLFAPSVFNFFLPDYQPNGPIADEDLVAPEFQLHNTATSIGFINVVLFWITEGYLMDNTSLYSALGQNVPAEQVVAFDWERYAAIDNDEVLLDELSLLLCNDQLSEGTRQIIRTALQPLDIAPEFKIYVALYLILISPDYNITR